MVYSRCGSYATSVCNLNGLGEVLRIIVGGMQQSWRGDYRATAVVVVVPYATKHTTHPGLDFLVDFLQNERAHTQRSRRVWNLLGGIFRLTLRLTFVLSPLWRKSFVLVISRGGVILPCYTAIVILAILVGFRRVAQQSWGLTCF